MILVVVQMQDFCSIHLRVNKSLMINKSEPVGKRSGYAINDGRRLLMTIHERTISRKIEKKINDKNCRQETNFLYLLELYLESKF